MAASSTPPPVGALLAEKRVARGLSLQDLSRLSGVSKGMISQVENGQVNPTLAVVWKLASGLGLNIQELLQGEEPVKTSAFQMLTEATCPTLQNRANGNRIQILSTPDMVEKTELYLVHLDPNGKMVSSPHARGTVETLTVLRGEVEIELAGEQIHVLKTLESARYSADVTHSVRSHGRKDALAYLAVKFPPPKGEAR